MHSVRALQGLLVVAVLGLALALSAPHDRPDYQVVPGESVAVDTVEQGSTWYCPTGAAGEESHSVQLVNVGDETLTATVTSLGHEQVNRSETVHEVAPNTPVDVGVARGAVVEFNGPGGTVWERLDDDTGTSSSSCRRDSSPAWYFAAADTTTGSDATIWLLNPFPTDASVSVIVSTPDGTRTPGDLDGIVLPGGTSRPVPLDESISVRPQFAFTVETLAGRVIASLTQSSDGTGEPEDGSPARRGIAIVEGMPSPAVEMVFADGISGEGVTERYVLYNPGDDTVDAVVTAVPADTDPSLLPEPFDVEIPPGRYRELVLSSESRIPVGAFHSVQILAEGGGVVAARVTDIFDGGGDGSARPTVGAGMSVTGGALVTGLEWVVPRSTVGPEDLVVVRNLSDESIAVVSVTVWVDGVETQVAADVEIVAGSVGVVPLVLDDISGPVLVAVASSESVVVEYRGVQLDPASFSMAHASPLSVIDEEEA